MGTRQYKITERQINDTAFSSFENFRSAKLLFHGDIVQNMSIVRGDDRGWEYSLIVGTTANCIYRVNFMPYFFKKDKTIMVEEPRVVESSGSLKTFEVTQDPETQETVYVYGFAISPSFEPSVAGDIG
jgi:hypothetical protein